MATQSVPLGVEDAVPFEPIYTLCGSEQPPEFSRAARAALDAIRSVEAKDEDLSFRNHHDMAEDMRRALDEVLGGRLSIEQSAVIATLCEVLAFYSQVGAPDYSVWVPFGDVWLGANGEIPPEGTMFFEVDDAPYSVEPNLHTREWHGTDSCTTCHVDTIRGRAKRITRHRFDVLRWKKRKTKDSTAIGASAGAQ